VVALTRRFPHHSSYSGYWQIVRRHGGVELLGGRAVPPRLADAAVRRSGRLAYTPSSLGLELAGAVRLLSKPRTLCHVLYGEDDYHYLARAAPLVRRAGGKLVASFHQPPTIFDLAFRGGNAERLLPRLDAALVTTLEQRSHLARWMPADRVHHVPHGVDTGFFTPEARPASVTRTVLTVGTWQRDFELLEEVTRSFAARGEQVRFVVVSSEATTRRFAGLPNVEARSGVSDDELRRLYRRSDALFLPLVQAAANNALLEAMACGLPIIASDFSGTREYAGPTGARYVPPFDRAAAVEAIARLLGDDAARTRLGRDARERALRFDWNPVVAALEEVYRHVAEAPPR
jgi:glycosyltransferase involved in cell wall biosynthesis